MSGKHDSSTIANRLAELRRARDIPAAELARLAGVSRQTVYAMEAGSYVPNTLVALKLARALDATVEEIFSLPAGGPGPELPELVAELLPGGDSASAGQPVELCRVGRRLVACPPSPLPWYFPASDAVLTEDAAGDARVGVRVVYPDYDSPNRILVAGCDPGISVLAGHLRAAGVELVLAHRNSSQALALLQQGRVHVAGTHLRDEASGESNLPEIARRFPRRAVAVISYAVWEEGIVTAPGNPKHIRAVEDLAREDVTIVNREAGAGSRRLLDEGLKLAHVPHSRIRGYSDTASGHLPAAWRVRTGAADACIATRAAARLFGLGFVPLVSERYDLAILRRHLDLPPVRALLDTLSHAGFRRQLEGLGGYDTRSAGDRLM